MLAPWYGRASTSPSTSLPSGSGTSATAKLFRFMDAAFPCPEAVSNTKSLKVPQSKAHTGIDTGKNHLQPSPSLRR